MVGPNDPEAYPVGWEIRQGELDGFEVLLGAESSDDHRRMVRRAGQGANGLDLLLEEGFQAAGVQGLRLMVEERFVRQPTALGDEQEVVLVPLGPRHVHLRR